MHPCKVNELNAWCEGKYDEPGVKTPLNQDDWLGSDNPDFCMFGIYDGWGWNAIQAGLQCQWGSKWEIEDINIHKLFQHFVALPMGLVIIINIDWYATVLHSDMYTDQIIAGSKGSNTASTRWAPFTPPSATIPDPSASCVRKQSFLWSSWGLRPSENCFFLYISIHI